MRWRHLVILALGAWLSGCRGQDPLKKGEQFLELGDWDKAVEQFNLAVDRSPRDPRAHWGLALAYARSDSAGPALKEYRVLCRLSPGLADDPLLRQKMAGFLGIEPFPSRRLTRSPGNDAFPAISPDGKKIAFSSKRDGDTELYLMDSDGDNQQRLTKNRGVDYAPSFSPDGRMLAFVSDRDGNDEIYILEMPTGRQKRLTYHSGQDVLPAFSPDGSRVWFISDREDKYQIYSLEVGGAGSGREKGLSRVFDDQNNKIYFSVGGDQMLIQEERENQVVLCLAPIEGGPKRLLAAPSFRAGLPTVLSPDRRSLLFTSSREGDDEIYLWNMAQGYLTRLTFSPSQEFGFGFTPDGCGLIYDSNRYGDRDIFIMRLDSPISREELMAAMGVK